MNWDFSNFFLSAIPTGILQSNVREFIQWGTIYIGNSRGIIQKFHIVLFCKDIILENKISQKDIVSTILQSTNELKKNHGTNMFTYTLQSRIKNHTVKYILWVRDILSDIFEAKTSKLNQFKTL